MLNYIHLAQILTSSSELEGLFREFAGLDKNSDELEYRTSHFANFIAALNNNSNRGIFLKWILEIFKNIKERSFQDLCVFLDIVPIISLQTAALNLLFHEYIQNCPDEQIVMDVADDVFVWRDVSASLFAISSNDEVLVSWIHLGVFLDKFSVFNFNEPGSPRLCKFTNNDLYGNV